MTVSRRAETSAVRQRARVRLRPTMHSDRDCVLSPEHDRANLPFVTPWERARHEAAIRIPDSRHVLVEGGEDRA